MDLTPATAALTPLSSTPRSTLRRYPARARTDRAELYALLDGALACTLSTIVDGAPRAVPMAYARIDDTLYLHGSPRNQPLRALAAGAEACVTVVEVDALVLADTLFHHSLNFRCAVVYSTARTVTDEAERHASFTALVNHLAPGRSAELGPATSDQLASVLVVALSLAEASLKVRLGPSHRDPGETPPRWSGVLPLNKQWADPQRDPDAPTDVAVPRSVARLAGRPAARLTAPVGSESAT